MIRKASVSDVKTVAALAAELWPDSSAGDHLREFETLLKTDSAAVFLLIENDAPAGFAQCQLRNDYVEGTSSSPVGYLEGIYVRKEFRRHGYAGELLNHCTNWAKSKGCAEFASDCEIDNAVSLAFHLRSGFIEANRIICFTRNL